MKTITWKKGDWCFCEFVLQQIKEMNGEDITSVTDGFFNLGSSSLNDRCFPVELDIKVKSDNVKYWNDEFHKLKNNSLNYPDLNRELISRWVALCIETDEKKLQKLYDSLSKFGSDVLRSVYRLNNESVDGVRLFR